MSGASAAAALVIGLLGFEAAAVAPLPFGQTASPAAFKPFKIDALATPAPMDSGEVRLSASGNRAVLSWIEHAARKSTLKFSERTAAGWSAPLAVPPASGAGLVVNAADVPLVHPLKNGQLVAVWTYEQPKNREALSVGLSWSKDNGRTWSPAITPHRDNTETEHSFGGVFDLAGGFGAMWLDGRAMTGGKPGADMALWSASYGADGKPGAEAPVDPRVCECCQTATAVTSEGPIVAYRDRSPGEIRDIAVVRFAGGKWSAPALVHADNWKIDGCPVNGPALDAGGQAVAAAWFTAAGGKGQVFTVFSQDAGKTFGRPVRVDDGSGTGRVQVALLPDRSSAVTWVESGNPGSQVRLRRVAADGRRGPAVMVADGAGTQYPRMVRRGDELLFAWADQTRGVTRVRTARASLK